MQSSIRYPAAWEANLLAASTLLMLILSTGLLTVFFPLPVVLIVGQLLVITPALLWVMLRHFPLRVTFNLTPVSARTILWSVLIGFACWPVVAGVSSLLEKPLALIGPYPPGPIPGNWIESIAFGLTYIVLAPLTEEPIYRGFILQAWLRKGKWAGILLSGILFGLLHSQIAPLLPLTFLGIVFGILAYRNQSMLSAIFAHASYNTAATLFVVIPALQSTPNDVFIIAGGIAFPITLFLIWLFLRRTPEPLTAPAPQERISKWKTIITFLIVVGLYGIMIALELVMRLYPNLKDLKGG
jgi:membrane protease YdiL (CAAX protease family)